MTSQDQPEISIVVPLFNEESVVDELFSLLKSTMEKVNRKYEILFVNDGSTDHTLERLIALCHSDPRVIVLSLKGNSGQTAALSAGFKSARGNIIISMDGDLQHDPTEIPNFLREIDNGFDIVSGWRKNRIDPYFSRKLPSKIANFIMAKFSGIPLHDFGTTYKAYRREVLESITLYGQFHRFIPALVEGMKVKIKEIPIRSLERKSGKSNYNISRTFTVFFDLIRIRFLTRSLNRPLQVFGSLGFLLGSSGFFIALYLTYLKFFHHISIMEYRAPLFLLSILLMLIGTQFLTLGLLGEIMVKVYYRLPGTRIFTVEKVITQSQVDETGTNNSNETNSNPD